jgi:hypothetical protein
LDSSLLFAAVSRNSVGITKSIIKAGVDPNTRSSSGVTALMIASYHGNDDLVKMLIKLGADPHLTSVESGNALHAALLRGHYSIAEYLVAQHVQPFGLTNTMFSTYASAIAHQMVGENLQHKDKSQAKALLLTSFNFYQKTIEKGKIVHDEAGSNIWKIRFLELLQYTAVALPGIEPYTYTCDPANLDNHIAMQDLKSGYKGVQKRVEEIIIDSKQRAKICENLIAAL